MSMIRIFSEKHMQQYGLTSDELDRLNAEWQEKAKMQGLEEHMPEYWQQARLHADSVFAGRVLEGAADLSGAPPVDEPVDLPALDVDIHDLTGTDRGGGVEVDAGAELVAIDLGDLEEMPAEMELFPELAITLEEGAGEEPEESAAVEEAVSLMVETTSSVSAPPVVMSEAEEIAIGAQEEMAAAEEVDRMVTGDQPVMEGEEPEVREISGAAVEAEEVPARPTVMSAPAPPVESEENAMEETSPFAESAEGSVEETPPAGQVIAETAASDREESPPPSSFWSRLLAAAKAMFKGH
ncbi:MAG: hypothetical protein ACOY32_04860 [Thermodesulfobacteriota bacterium]